MTVAFPGVRAQFGSIRRRTRMTTGVSVVVHALLLLLLGHVKPEPPIDEGLVEISWIELPAPAPARVAPPAPVEGAEPKGEERPAPPAPRFEPQKRTPRELVRAQTKPTPQRKDATRDVLQAKLATVSPTATSRTEVASLLPKAEVTRPTLAAPAATPTDAPRELARDAGKKTAPPSELLRAPARETRTSSDLAQLLDEPVPTSAAPATDAVFESREVLAGVSLAGPVADRALVTWKLPEYPESAKLEALEGSVQLRFIVAPNGEVKNNVMIERTSGFEDFDHNALVALLAWQFEPLREATADQWGSITLNYRLDGP